MLRDGQTGDWIGTFVGHKGAVWCARLNAAATQAATAAADFSVKLWDALSGAELHTLQHKHIVKSVCFSSDATRLYTGGAEKKLRIFDLARPDAPGQELTDHAQTISQVLTTSDENLIVTGAAEKDIRIWDRRTGAVAQRLATSGDVRYAQTTLDGSVLSVATGGKEVSFYNTANMQRIKSFTMPREIDTVSYDPVHQRFITVSRARANRGHHSAGAETEGDSSRLAQRTERRTARTALDETEEGAAAVWDDAWCLMSMSVCAPCASSMCVGLHD